METVADGSFLRDKASTNPETQDLWDLLEALAASEKLIPSRTAESRRAPGTSSAENISKQLEHLGSARNRRSGACWTAQRVQSERVAVSRVGQMTSLSSAPSSSPPLARSHALVAQCSCSDLLQLRDLPLENHEMFDSFWCLCVVHGELVMTLSCLSF
ncbi:hypothetical protein DNTS_001754 [Danionella cerebrum]|uniref:Uncharacterized protein n=1 Tax=Danionella cerebrum TaxID=2873325 RepID=A0A553MRW5_9TELE|nr:hypothetical protein DNTS_001754 [Danionella translucida]